MNIRNKPSLLYRGRPIGVLVTVISQLLIGIMHLFFGMWMLSTQITPFADPITPTAGLEIYSLYTIVFSLLTIAFAVPLWVQKLWGWAGTIGVALFVIVADTLTLLDLPSVPGIPKFAGFVEIAYSVVIVLYLVQEHVRARYRISS